MPELFADIALAFPSQTTFQYSIPEELKDRVSVGKRVFVSVRTRAMVGYVVGVSSERAIEDVRAMDSVIDDLPILSPQFLQMTRWMSDYYMCSWGQAIEAALPAPFKKGKFVMKSRSKKLGDGVTLLDDAGRQLTAHQTEAFEKILTAIKAKRSAKFLLHGITGSGKNRSLYAFDPGAHS